MNPDPNKLAFIRGQIKYYEDVEKCAATIRLKRQARKTQEMLRFRLNQYSQYKLF